MPSTTPPASAPAIHDVAIIGGGPAGLMAAEALARQGIPADVYDGMPSVGRKFLLAGRGGLNLTHSEPAGRFNARYGARSAAVALCGGEVETGTKVDEEWLLAVERREFVALLRTPETQARIRHTLETGKPLRN